jgi:hypothetical protein
MKPSNAKPSSAAQRLLEAGRQQSPLSYDVEEGLARHHQHLQSGAPLPSWAAGTRGALPGSSLRWRLLRLLFAGAVAGPLVVVLWPAPERPAQPTPESSSTARPRAAAPTAAADAAPLAPAEPGTRVRAPEPSAPVRRRAANGLPARAARPRASLASTDAPSQPPAQADAEHAPAAPSEAEPASAPTGASHAGPVHPASRETPKQKQPESRDRDEVHELARAERWLASAPQRALELVRRGDARFPDGYLRQERAYVAILALIELGELVTARAEAERFFVRYPDTPYAARVRRALHSGVGPTPDGGQ